MYRRVSSGRFMVLTTAGIVLVMSIFTWVMYGMAQRVVQMTGLMVSMSQDIHTMAILQKDIVAEMTGMHRSMTSMDVRVHDMSSSVRSIAGHIETMGEDVGTMSREVGVMSGAVTNMSGLFGHMTYSVGRTSHAFSSPMNYMWGSMMR